MRIKWIKFFGYGDEFFKIGHDKVKSLELDTACEQLIIKYEDSETISQRNVCMCSFDYEPEGDENAALEKVLERLSDPRTMAVLQRLADK